MTLRPFDNWDVKAVDGPPFKVGPYCAVPSCTRVAEHAHHIWRRSGTGKPTNWIELPDGSIVGNLTGLCVRHHDDVTGRIGGHKNAIRLTKDRVFWWCRVEDEHARSYEYLAPLDPQPPTRESLVASPATSGSDRCPTCGQQKKARRSSASVTAGERRRRKSWVIQVPDDDEDGATALDVLVDDLAPIFGYEQHPNTRYFTVARALVHAQQDKQRLVASDRGRGA